MLRDWHNMKMGQIVLIAAILVVMSTQVACGGYYEPQPEPPNAFRCYPNRTIHFVNPNKTIYTHFKAFYDVAGYRAHCYGSADSSLANIFFDCASTTATVTAFFSDRSLTNDYILGGKDVSVLCYTFICANLTSYNTTISKDLNVSVSKIDEFAAPTYDITAGFFSSPGVEVTTAEVGDTVYFVITGPAEYDLLPLECYASGSGGEYETIIINGCSLDYSLMSPFHVHSGPVVTEYNSTLYVFKFYDSDKLTITCNVQVCVSGNCPIYCGYTARRKRREAVDIELLDNEDIRTASVGKSLRIIDHGLGGARSLKSSFIFTAVMSTLIGLMTMF